MNFNDVQQFWMIFDDFPPTYLQFWQFLPYNVRFMGVILELPVLKSDVINGRSQRNQSFFSGPCGSLQASPRFIVHLVWVTCVTIPPWLNEFLKVRIYCTFATTMCGQFIMYSKYFYRLDGQFCVTFGIVDPLFTSKRVDSRPSGQHQI